MTANASVSFGPLLKRYRLAAGLTQEDLAARSGLSPRAISDLERGVHRAPRPETLRLLIEALGLSPRERQLLEASAHRQLGPSLASPQDSTPFLSQRSQWPLVGRMRELALIDQHLAGVGPAVVVFAGEPGIGKTRLLDEAARQAPRQGWRVLTGGCHRRSGQEPYAPLLGILEQHFALQSPAELHRALAGCTWLPRLLPELAEKSPERMPTWTLPPEQERRLMFGAVARYLANVAGPAGTLLLLDDLQWTGPDGLDLLAFLIRASAQAPLRVVAAYRDTEVRTQDPLTHLLTDLAREGYALRSALAPLSTGEAAALLDALLSEVSNDQMNLRQRVLQRAGGVPFFLVSCVHALRAGILEGEQRSVEATGLPWSAAETIRQRVTALPELAQEVLAVAAVVGRGVPRALLLGVMSLPDRHEKEVLEALEAACQARLLLEDEEATYTFAHDLVREMIVADLSAARRAWLHRQVAQTLEQGPGVAPVEVLAYHYSLADESERAVKYMERAAMRAQTIHAYTEAEHYSVELVKRLDGLGRTEMAALAREKLGDALMSQARYDDALAVLEQAVATYKQSGNGEAWQRSLAQVGWVMALRGTPQAGTARIEPMLASLGASGSSPGLAALYVTLAYLYFASGRYAEQLAMAERAVELARTMQEERTLIVAQDRRALALLMLGRLEECQRILAEEVIPRAEAAEDLRTLARALDNLGAVYGLRGDAERERQYLERSSTPAERIGDPADSAFGIYRHGQNAYFIGDWEQAQRDFEQAVTLIRPVARSRYAPYPRLGLGGLLLAKGNWKPAIEYLEDAARLAENTGDVQALRGVQGVLAEYDLLEARPEVAQARLTPLSRDLEHQGTRGVEVLSLLAWAHLELGQPTRARRLVEWAITQARTEHMRPALVSLLSVQVRIGMRQSRWLDAESALEEALDLCRAIRAPYLEAKTLYICGLLSLEQREFASARVRLEKALSILLRLGERLYASHIEQVLAEFAPRREC